MLGGSGGMPKENFEKDALRLNLEAFRTLAKETIGSYCMVKCYNLRSSYVQENLELLPC